MNEHTKVRELTFSDLYLGHLHLADRFSGLPGTDCNPIPSGAALRADLDRLTGLCRAACATDQGATDFAVRHDGVAYRVSAMNVAGERMFIVRRIADHIGSLAQLGVPQAYIPHLMTKDLSGLLVISGTNNAGKTTTACTLIKERLQVYGGVAITAENPIELPLEGSHGHGVCYQTALPTDPGEFGAALRQAARWGARMIFVDEIRDRDAATQLLQASVNGPLIVTTLRAQNVAQAITKLHALTHDAFAPGGASALLAEGLIGVLHQDMVRGTSNKLNTEFLFLKDAPLTRIALRQGKYESLSSDIRRQMTNMITGSAVAHRQAGV